MSEGMLEPTLSDRGFKKYYPIKGFHAGEERGSIRVYESSAASGPHLWVSVEDGLEDKESIVHLPLYRAEILRDQLTLLIQNHYQLEDDRWAEEVYGTTESSVTESVDYQTTIRYAAKSLANDSIRDLGTDLKVAVWLLDFASDGGKENHPWRLTGPLLSQTIVTETTTVTTEWAPVDQGTLDTVGPE